jgi:deoxycytidine triphosphate deaminase
MTVLTDTEIRRLVNSEDLIESFEADCLEGASYDMRLGRDYMIGGIVRVLNDDNPSYSLQPGEFVILTSLERLNMPLNLVAHNGIMSPWARLGLVSLFSPQIDPGFEGILTVPVFNAGDAPISLQRYDCMFTVEFVHTGTHASYGWSSHHGRQTAIPSRSGPLTTMPNMTQVKSAMEQFAALSTRVDELNHSIEQRVVQVEADVKVVENRVGDVITGRQIRIGRAQIAVAIIAILVTLAVGIVSSHFLWPVGATKSTQTVPPASSSTHVAPRSHP